jgi:hypothetical protein
MMTGVTSYTSTISGYEQNQRNLFSSGSLYLDPQRNCLVAVTPLSVATRRR